MTIPVSLSKAQRDSELLSHSVSNFFFLWGLIDIQKGEHIWCLQLDDFEIKIHCEAITTIYAINLWIPRGEVGCGVDWETGTDSTMHGMATSEWCRELYVMPCGHWDGKEVQKGEDMCIHLADSLCCKTETSTTLSSNYPSMQTKRSPLLANLWVYDSDINYRPQSIQQTLWLTL